MYKYNTRGMNQPSIVYKEMRKVHSFVTPTSRCAKTVSLSLFPDQKNKSDHTRITIRETIVSRHHGVPLKPSVHCSTIVLRSLWRAPGMPRDTIVSWTVDVSLSSLVILLQYEKKKTWRVTDSRWVVNNTYNKHGVPKISLSNILPSRAFIHSCSITISTNFEIQSFFLSS